MASAGVLGAVGMMPSLASSLPLGSALPRLEHETELQKLLADERMRSEQHKTNYQQLKIEHSRYAGFFFILMVCRHSLGYA